MKTFILLILLTVVMPMACLSQTNIAERDAAGSSAKLERMPELLETRFALSAAPPHLRDRATMPHKDTERKREWERLHRNERLARRRELRYAQAVEQTTRPQVTTESSGGVGFLAPLGAGVALAAWNPMLGMGAGSLTLVVAGLGG